MLVILMVFKHILHVFENWSEMLKCLFSIGFTSIFSVPFATTGPSEMLGFASFYKHLSISGPADAKH